MNRCILLFFLSIGLSSFAQANSNLWDQGNDPKGTDLFEYKSCPGGASELTKRGTMCCREQQASSLLRDSICFYLPMSTTRTDYDLIVAAGNHLIPEPPLPYDTKHTLVGRDSNTEYINWWYEKREYNEAIGRAMFNKDLERLRYAGLPRVTIEVSVYRIENGYNEDIGYEIGSFYGRQEYPDKDKNFVQSLSDGLFKAFVNLGNPLTNFIKLGFSNFQTKKKVIRKVVISSGCSQMERCDVSNTQPIMTETSSSNIRETANFGFGMSLIRLSDQQPGKPYIITLSDLTINYAEDIAPQAKSMNDRPNITRTVKYTNMVNGQDVVLPDGESVIMATQASISSTDTRGNLTKDTAQTNSQFYIMIRAAVNKQLTPDGWDDRSYTPEQDDQLAKNSTTFKRMLETMEVVCFKNKANPFSGASQCGLRLTELDKAHKHYGIRFKVKKARGIKSNLKYWDADGDRKMMAGDIYLGHGYYPLPQFSDSKDGDVRLEIGIDDERDLKADDGAKRAIVTLKYNPSWSLPLSLGASSSSDKVLLKDASSERFRIE